MSLPEHIDYTVDIGDDRDGLYRLAPVTSGDLQPGVYVAVHWGMARAFVVLDEPEGLGAVADAVNAERRRKGRLRERFDL